MAASVPWVPDGWALVRQGPAHPRADDSGKPFMEMLVRCDDDPDMTVEVTSVDDDDEPRVDLLVRQNFGTYPAVTGLRWSPREGLRGDDANQELWLTLYAEHVDALEQLCSRNWGFGPPASTAGPTED